LIVKLKIALTENTLNITTMVSLCSKCTAHKGAILNYMLHYWSGSYWDKYVHSKCSQQDHIWKEMAHWRVKKFHVERRVLEGIIDKFNMNFGKRTCN